jgi:hypothetical protein
LIITFVGAGVLGGLVVVDVESVVVRLEREDDADVLSAFSQSCEIEQ